MTEKPTWFCGNKRRKLLLNVRGEKNHHKIDKLFDAFFKENSFIFNLFSILRKGKVFKIT